MEGGEHHQEQGGGPGHPGWIQEADCQQGGELRGIGGQVQRLQLCQEGGRLGHVWQGSDAETI